MLAFSTPVVAIFGSQVVKYYRGKITQGRVIAIDHHDVVVFYVDRIDGQRDGRFVGSDRTVNRLSIGDRVEIRYVAGSALFMWAEAIEGANKNLLYTAIVLLALYAKWKVYRRYVNEKVRRK